MFVYSANLRPIPSGDTAPAAVLPLAVWLDGTTRLDRFAPWFTERFDGHPYFLHAREGHYYSSYPIASALLVTPLYAPVAIVAPELRQWAPRDVILLARVLEKLAAAFLAAATVALFFLLARCYVDERRAALLAFVFAFATSVWSINAQALWQHTGGLLAIVCSLYLLARGWIPAAALTAALSVAMRPTNALFVAASVAVLVLHKKDNRAAAWYVCSAAIIGGLLAGYNWEIFRNIRGGYVQPFSGDFVEGFAGLIASPGRGLFVYTPLALLALREKPRHHVQTIAVVFALAHLLIYTKWPMWWGGHCWGPRMLVEAAPAIILLLMHARITRTFVLLAVLSIGTQLVGVFCYPNGSWDSKPVSVDRQPQRLWDWNDNPIARTLSAGPLTAPYSYALETVRAWIERRPPRLDTVPVASIRYN